MPEVKNIFVGAKMNKDLNPRMISNQEYIDARNAAVINSEGSDSGLLQNVSGNTELTDFGLYGVNLEVIGFYIDTTNNRIFAFITDWNDVSNDQLSHFASSASHHYICVFDTRTNQGTTLVSGSFLNFSKTHPVLGINLLENLLFFTDNRNQPRKINVTTALSNPSYYSKEEDISVAKYYPWNSLKLSKLTGNGDLFPSAFLNITTNIDDGDDGSYPGVIGTGNFTTSGTGVGGAITVLVSDGVVESVIVSDDISLLGAGFAVGDTITVAGPAELGSTEDLIITLTRNNLNQDSTMRDVVSKNLPKTEVVEVVATGGINSFTANRNIDTNWVGATVTSTNSNGEELITVLDNIKVTEIVGPTITLENNVGINQNDIVTIGANPYYDETFSGDVDYLTDRFVRFSYRFKYDDDEYSLIAPFSQIAFIPKQDGYFLEDSIPENTQDSEANSDENRAIESTIISFFENKVNSIGLLMDMPEGVSTVSNLSSYLKVKEIDILYKESDSNAIKIIETIPTADLKSNGNTEFLYQYTSQIPIKTLPSNEITRVSDKVPIRAKAQELSGNRIMYGNYLARTSRPSNLPFSVLAGEKLKAGKSDSVSEIEYPNHSLKQNRSYKVGFVLVDKFGRQSDVISSGLSTIYNPYLSKSPSFLTSTDIYRGDSLKIQFNGLIPSQIGNPGYAGLYSEDNPTGWYSYKVVVQQKEQDYYNVYLPTVLNNYPGTAPSLSFTPNSGYNAGQYSGEVGVTPGWTVINAPAGVGLVLQVIINADGTVQSVTITDPGNGRYPTGSRITVSSSVLGAAMTVPISVSPLSEEVAFLTLFSDNINKVPRDLKEVGPQDLQFSSSVNLYPRVNNNGVIFNQATNQQFETSPTPDKVVLIGTRDEIGVNLDVNGLDYNVSPFYGIPKAQVQAQPNVTPPITGELNLGANPYIAKLSTQKAVGTPGGNEVIGSDISYKDLRLNVYETEPFESSLDIFYETGSSGLISELNQSILSNVGSDFPTNIVNWTWDLKESTVPGDFISTAFFDVVNSAGTSLTTKVPGGVSLEILRVFKLVLASPTRIEQDITNDNLFEIYTDTASPNRFKLRTTSGSYFTYTETSASLDEYRFIFRCTVDRSASQQPNEVNEIAIGYIGYNNRLVNVKPTIIGLTTNPVFKYNIPSANWPTEKVNVPVPETTFFDLYEFDSANGTANPDVNEYKRGVVWSVNKVEFYWDFRGIWADYNQAAPVSQYLRLTNNTTIVNEQLQFSKGLRCINPDGTTLAGGVPNSVYKFNDRKDTQYRVLADVYDAGGYGNAGALNVKGRTYSGQFYIYFTMKRNN